MKKEENEKTEEQSNSEIAIGVIQGLIGIGILSYGLYIMFLK